MTLKTFFQRLNSEKSQIIIFILMILISTYFLLDNTDSVPDSVWGFFIGSALVLICWNIIEYTTEKGGKSETEQD